MRVWVKKILIALVALLVVIQVARPARTNPPVDPKLEISAVHTGSQQAMSVLERSCNDCHSNRTVWPWYSSVAPVSWLVANDVREGRGEMNLSEWGAYDGQKKVKLLGKICEEVKDGEMPGTTYGWMHPQARLTSADVQTVCAFTTASLQGLPARSEKEEKEEDGD